MMGVLIGCVGAMFLSIMSAAVYDYLKGNNLFATLVNFLVSVFKLLVKKIHGLNTPVWALLLILLVVIVIILILSKRSKNRNRKRTR